MGRRAHERVKRSTDELQTMVEKFAETIEVFEEQRRTEPEPRPPQNEALGRDA